MTLGDQSVLYPDVDPRLNHVHRVMQRHTGIVHEIVVYPYTVCGKEVVLKDDSLPFGIRHRTVYGIAAGYQMRVTCKSCRKGLILRGAGALV